MLLNLPPSPLPKQLLLLMKMSLNLLSNLANILLNSIARKVAGCVSFAVSLAWIKLGQNAKNIVQMVLKLVPKFVLLVKPSVWNLFHPFLTYRLQLMRKYMHSELPMIKNINSKYPTNKFQGCLDCCYYYRIL